MTSTITPVLIRDHLLAGRNLAYCSHHHVVVNPHATPNDQVDGYFSSLDGTIESAQFDFYLSTTADLDLNPELSAEKAAEAKEVWATGEVATLAGLGLDEADTLPISLVVDAETLTVDAMTEGLTRWLGQPVHMDATRVVDEYGAWQFNVTLAQTGG